MTLGIVNNSANSACMTSKLPIIKNELPCDNVISCREIVTKIVNRHYSNFFATRSSLIIYLLSLVTLIECYRIGNRNFHSKLRIIVFQMNSIFSLIASEWKID